MSTYLIFYLSSYYIFLLKEKHDTGAHNYILTPNTAHYMCLDFQFILTSHQARLFSRMAEHAAASTSL